MFHSPAGSGVFRHEPAIVPFYSRESLLSFILQNLPPPDFGLDFSGKIKKKSKKKRGSRGGVRNRLKRNGYRPPLPSITLSNVRSIQNKLDELSALLRHDCDYRRSSLLCFTETWWSENNADYEIEGYTTIRFNRDTKKTKKSIGGGLCLFVNKKWATNFTVRERFCTMSYEIMTVSFHPHYLPREFGQVTVILVYMLGPDNAQAAECIAECYN